MRRTEIFAAPRKFNRCDVVRLDCHGGDLHESGKQLWQATEGGEG